MTTFVRVLGDRDKETALHSAVRRKSDCVFDVDPSEFRAIPGAPFAYWVSGALRALFQQLPPFEADGRTARQGLATSDDFRFVRVWWEILASRLENPWMPFTKGGGRSAYYAEISLCLNWASDGRELKAFAESTPGTTHWSRRVFNTEFYFRPGFSWALRSARFAPSCVPAKCIFSVSRYQAFDDESRLLATIGLLNASVCNTLLRMCSENYERPKYVIGIVQSMPYPAFSIEVCETLEERARRCWSLKRTLDEVAETSHAFVLPEALRVRLGHFSPIAIVSELDSIQGEIDTIGFDLYGLSEAERPWAGGVSDKGNSMEVRDEGTANVESSEDDEDVESEVSTTDSLLSWAVGVAFGRFDWRLATGERQAPPEPEPFDPLPAKSPGMLPDGATSFHEHAGILVDDAGDPHDLARLVEEVLERVKTAVPSDVRRWLQRDFFLSHLQHYSKSRRKAPIYWPLATESGSYTLWVYYPALSDQTLYRTVNDFVEPKLKQVSERASQLRSKGGDRNRAEEREFEETESLEVELTEFRDSLLMIAMSFHPNQDDGVQITAAPLWPLFRHKPWQKVLKDTWGKLEKGEYDWAHIAMRYWPERVREKCKTDKSLAIAHNVEDLYVEKAAAPKTVARSRKQ